MKQIKEIRTEISIIKASICEAESILKNYNNDKNGPEKHKYKFNPKLIEKQKLDLKEAKDFASSMPANKKSSSLLHEISNIEDRLAELIISIPDEWK